MGHCTREELADLGEVLDAIRRLDAIRETTHGIFYVGRTPFLHFHSEKKTGKRWADARAGEAWGRKLPLPFGASAAARKRFLAEAKRRHGKTLAALAPRRRG